MSLFFVFNLLHEETLVHNMGVAQLSSTHEDNLREDAFRFFFELLNN